MKATFDAKGKMLTYRSCPQDFIVEDYAEPMTRKVLSMITMITSLEFWAVMIAGLASVLTGMICVGALILFG